MPPVEFEPTISAGERPQTYALDRAATGTDYIGIYRVNNQVWQSSICKKLLVRVLPKTLEIMPKSQIHPNYCTPLLINP